VLAILVGQLCSVVVLFFVVVGVISFAFCDIVEAVAIAVVLVINAVLGFVIEWWAWRAMEGLLGFAVQAVIEVIRVRIGETALIFAGLALPSGWCSSIVR